MTVLLRRAGPLDASLAAEIQFDAVRHGTGAQYSASARRGWMPSARPVPGLSRRLGRGRAWIAGPGGRGLLAAGADGHLDLFFVRPAEQGGPVAPSLYDAYAVWLDREGITSPTTHASRLLRPFLERRGWRVTERQTVLRRGARLERFAMRLV